MTLEGIARPAIFPQDGRWARGKFGKLHFPSAARFAPIVTIPDPVHDSPGERHGCVWSPRAASLLFWVRKISLPMQKRGSSGASWWHHRPHEVILCFSNLTGEIIGEACRDPGLLSSSTSPSSLLPLLSIKPLGRPLLCRPPSSFLQLAPSLPGNLVHRRLCLLTLTLPLSAPL